MTSLLMRPRKFSESVSSEPTCLRYQLTLEQNSNKIKGLTQTAYKYTEKDSQKTFEKTIPVNEETFDNDDDASTIGSPSYYEINCASFEDLEANNDFNL